MTNDTERTQAQRAAHAMRAATIRLALERAAREPEPALAYGCVDWFRYDAPPQPQEADPEAPPVAACNDAAQSDAPRRHSPVARADDRAARAVLTDYGITISLEIRFAQGRRAVPSRRLGRSLLTIKAGPGMRVPVYGQVGWYESQRGEPVWCGAIRAADYRCVPA